MTAEQFKAWLAEMKFATTAETNRDCARLLGVTPEYISMLKKRGTSKTIALACTAVRASLRPYPS